MKSYTRKQPRNIDSTFSVTNFATKPLSMYREIRIGTRTHEFSKDLDYTHDIPINKGIAPPMYSGGDYPDIDRCLVPVRIGGTVQEILAASPVGSLVHRIHDETYGASVRRAKLKAKIKKAKPLEAMTLVIAAIGMMDSHK